MSQLLPKYWNKFKKKSSIWSSYRKSICAKLRCDINSSSSSIIFFHQIGPLGQFGQVVTISVLIMSPSHAIFFEAPFWPSDHMISSRPIIGQPSPPPQPIPPKAPQWAVRGGLGKFPTFWVRVPNDLLTYWGSGI